jgi:hypothetical protein
VSAYDVQHNGGKLVVPQNYNKEEIEKQVLARAIAAKDKSRGIPSFAGAKVEWITDDYSDDKLFCCAVVNESDKYFDLVHYYCVEIETIKKEN